MTILKITIEDEQAVSLRYLLKDVSYVKKIEEESVVSENAVADNKSSLERIKQILEEAKGKDLFKDVKDPSEWQRELRKEWDRDF